MKNIKEGDKLLIHCYKHNGELHRTCDEATVLEINRDYIVCANDKTIIREKNSSKWHKYTTKEPAIIIFFNNCWYNVIAQLKEKGLFYYCNIASPYLIENGIIKYIDYDLDLRIFPNGDYKILDKNEYKYNKSIMNYNENIDLIIKQELKNLIELNNDKKFPFDEKMINKYYEKYIKCQ